MIYVQIDKENVQTTVAVGAFNFVSVPYLHKHYYAQYLK